MQGGRRLKLCRYGCCSDLVTSSCSASANAIACVSLVLLREDVRPSLSMQTLLLSLYTTTISFQFTRGESSTCFIRAISYLGIAYDLGSLARKTWIWKLFGAFDGDIPTTTLITWDKRRMSIGIIKRTT
jgi:hypothetical protein